jgi:NTE family protein
MSRALVLGGGGPVGVAWEAGVVAGLAESGVDLTAADRIIGTSAGSLVGARLARGATPAQLLEKALHVSAGNGAPRPEVDLERLMAVGAAMFESIDGERPDEEILTQVGRIALGADTISEDEFVAMTGRGLGDEWPERDYVCTAVDAESGAFRAWDAAAGASLERAVASSCSVPGLFPPMTIDGRRYVDGGVLSATNAFLAEGHDSVVVLSVLTGALAGLAEHLSVPLRREVAALEAGGSAVEVVEMGEGVLAITGGDLMDFDAGPAAAQVGRAEGRAAAERVGTVWG